MGTENIFESIGALCDRWALGPNDPERLAAHRIHGELLAMRVRDPQVILEHVRERLELRLSGGPAEDPPDVTW